MVDSMNRPQCGPYPAKVGFNAYLSKMANACAMPIMPPVTLFKISQPILHRWSPHKTEADVLNYMSCYREPGKVGDERFCHFKKTLSPLISLSSESAHLPYAVQACLIKRESSFKPTAGSSAGAFGYIQFMPGTEKTVNEVISGDVKKWQAQLDRANAEIAEQTALLKKTTDARARAKIRVRLNEWTVSRGFAKSSLEARKAWDRFWEGTRNAPKKVSRQSESCPNLAFAMGMVKEIYDLYQIKNFEVYRNLDGSPTIGSMGEFDSAIFLAGAYNSGVGAFGRVCGGTKTLQDCIRRFGKSETANHMISIRNCAANGSNRPMSGSTQLDCEKMKCS